MKATSKWTIEPHTDVQEHQHNADQRYNSAGSEGILEMGFCMTMVDTPGKLFKVEDTHVHMPRSIKTSVGILQDVVLIFIVFPGTMVIEKVLTRS